MKYKCTISPKGMITVKGITYRAHNGILDTNDNKALEDALDKNPYWEKASGKDVKEAEAPAAKKGKGKK